MDWLEGFAEWLKTVLSTVEPSMQSGWSVIVDVLGDIIRNPEPVAIGMATGVFVVLLGLVIGRAAFGHIDRKSSDSPDDEADVESEDDFDDSEDSLVDSDSSSEKW